MTARVPVLTARRRGRRRSDAGQAALLLVLSVAVLMSVAVVLITTMGRGVTVETEARTASDAAALAAAQGYVDAVETHLDAFPRTPGLAIGHLRQLLDLPQTTWTATARSEGSRLAAANGSTLTSFGVSGHGRAIRFSTQARATQVAVEGSSKRPVFAATAEVRLTGGPLCFGDHGALGIRWAGDCLLSDDVEIVPPSLDPDPTTGPDPTEEPAPPPPPDPFGPVVIEGDDLTSLLDHLRQPVSWQVALVD